MKIAYVYDVIHPFVLGGVQKRIWQISTRLAAKGHNVTLFGMKHWSGPNIVYQEGVRLWGVCPPSDLFTDGRRSIREAVSFGWNVIGPLMRERYDVVDAANFPFFPCFSAAFHSLARRSHLFITWHEIWDAYWYEYLGKKGAFGRAVERLVISLPHQAIAVSPHTADGLRRLGRKKVHLLPNGLDLAAIDAAVAFDQQSDIAYAGRLTVEKNVGLLIRAVHLLREHSPNIHCIIIGDGPERANLETMVRDHALERNVEFKGYLPEDSQVYSYMKSSRVLVLPSLREGFGLVVLEANACGLPAITVDHPLNAARTLINPGTNGLVCPPEPAALADSIMTVLGSRDDWAPSCKQNAGRYDWGLVAEDTERLYSSI